MNIVILEGRLGQDPESKVTTNGTTVLRFSMATTERRKDRDGNWEEFPVWHQCKIFGRRAESLGRLLHKGSRVLVEGTMRHDQWEDDQGQKRNFSYALVNNLTLLDPAPREQQVTRPEGRPVNTRQPQQRQDNRPFGQRPRQPASQGRAQPDTSFEPPFDDDGQDPFGGYDGN